MRGEEFARRWREALTYCERSAPDLLMKMLSVEALQKQGYRHAGYPLGDSESGRLLWVGRGLEDLKRRSA